MPQEKTYKLWTPANYKKEQYNYFAFSWNYVPAPPEDGVVKGMSYWKGCRDAGIAEMRDHILKGKIKTDYTRMMFHWTLTNAGDRAAAAAWMRRGLNTLHALEKLGGWALTRVYELEVPFKNVEVVYYFLSSRRWIKSSYLAYMYVLLVRMCGDPWWGKFKNFEAMKKAYKERKPGSRFSHDTGYIRQSFPYWEAIIRGYPQLFEKKKLEHYWSYELIGSTGSNLGEGIDKLTRNDSSYAGLYDELKQLKVQFDKEVKKNERKTESKGKGN